MFSTQSGSSRLSAHTYAAALALAAIAVSYAMLSVFYFYEDFFQYLGNGAPTMTDRTGWIVWVGPAANADGYYLVSILSPWRILGALLAVGMLSVSSLALWRNRPRARALSLITLWGVLFPQILWYTEFLVDWHQGQGLLESFMLAVAVCALPTALLSRSGRALADWSCSNPGRLLGFAVASAWIGFAATEFMDHAYQLDSWTAYSGALAAVVLSIVAVRGIYHLRTWGLVAGVGAAVALAMIPLAATWTSYVPNGTIIGQGFIDGLHSTTAGSDCRASLSMLIPMAALCALAAPFLSAFVRKLGNR